MSSTVAAAPFRLSSPRPLTGYEWTVVERTIADAIRWANPSLQGVEKLAADLTLAISRSSREDWKTTWYGPAPTVNLFPFGCLGYWFGKQPYQTYPQLILSIEVLLATRPWGACAYQMHNRNWSSDSQSEYSQQVGNLFQGHDWGPYDDLRRRTFYMPLAGGKLHEMVLAITGGQIPPQLAQVFTLSAPVLAQSSFLLGVTMKDPSGVVMPPLTTGESLGEKMALANALTDDIVVIWAPKAGVSLKPMLASGQFDPQALLTLLSGLGDGATIPGIDLIQILPGLIPGFGATTSSSTSSILTVGRAALRNSRTAPGQHLHTGLAITDKPGKDLDPKLGGSVDPAGISGSGGVYLAVGFLVLAAGLYLQGTKKQNRSRR